MGVRADQQGVGRSPAGLGGVDVDALPPGAGGPAFDLALAMAILSGPLYFQLLITKEPLTQP